MLVAFHTVLVEIWRGRFAAASLIAEDTMQLAEQVGGDLPLSVALTCRALLAAYMGRVDEARAAVEDARAANHRCGSERLGEWPAMALGFLEVSLGNYSDALEALQPLLVRVEIDAEGDGDHRRVLHPGRCRGDGGTGSARKRRATGDNARAERIAAAARLDDGGRWPRSGMLLAARGEVSEAVDAVEQAMSVHNRMTMPFERARTQLLLGQLQRRQRMKSVSALSFQEALTAFDQLGTPLWADRARNELGRVSLRRASRRFSARPNGEWPNSLRRE